MVALVSLVPFYVFIPPLFLTGRALHAPELPLDSLVAASLVGLSTLYTKQHYVLDVVGGVALALAAYVVFLRAYRPAGASELDRRVPMILAVGLAALLGLVLAACWTLYRSAGSVG